MINLIQKYKDNLHHHLTYVKKKLNFISSDST